MYIMLLGILRATVFATYTTYVTFSMFVTLSVFVATGGVLTPRKVFTVFSLYFLLAEMCVHCLATCFLVISEMQVSIRRIEVGTQINVNLWWHALMNRHFCLWKKKHRLTTMKV